MPRLLRNRRAKLERDRIAAIANRPALAAQMATIVTLWAYIERCLQEIFVVLVDGHAKVAMPIFMALKGNATQYDAIKAVARTQLPRRIMDEIDRVFTRIREEADPRNRVAHGLWTSSEDVPDALLFIESKDYLRFLTQPNFARTYNDKLIVYTKADFDEIIGKTANLYHDVDCLVAEIATYLLEEKERSPQQST
jgi:hypothetical protein